MELSCNLKDDMLTANEGILEMTIAEQGDHYSRLERVLEYSGHICRTLQVFDSLPTSQKRNVLTEDHEKRLRQYLERAIESAIPFGFYQASYVTPERVKKVREEIQVYVDSVLSGDPIEDYEMDFNGQPGSILSIMWTIDRWINKLCAAALGGYAVPFEILHELEMISQIIVTLPKSDLDFIIERNMAHNPELTTLEPLGELFWKPILGDTAVA